MMYNQNSRASGEVTAQHVVGATRKALTTAAQQLGHSHAATDIGMLAMVFSWNPW